MRSICARLSASNSAWPRVAEPTLTPSISTKVPLVLAPRRKKPLLCPGPPFASQLHPGRASEQVFDRIRGAVSDRVGLDDDDVADTLAEWPGFATTGDDDRAELALRCARQREKNGENAQSAARLGRTLNRRKGGHGRTRTSCRLPLPRERRRYGDGRSRSACWPVSGLTGRPGQPSRRLAPPVACAPELKPLCRDFARRTVAGAAQIRWRPTTLSFCFPFNCEGKNDITGTNGSDSRCGGCGS